MSWDILPKANLQYFLQKLKDKFSKVTANPSTTTETLNSIDIDGTSYAIPSASSVTGVKGSNESNYRTGDVNVSANNVGALGVVGNVTVSSLDDLVALCLNSGNNKAFEGPINISTDIGVGITGWCNTIGACLNGPNNGNVNIGLFCLFMSTNTSASPRYAIIDGKTTGNYSVTATGVFTRNADLANVATSGSYNDLSNKPGVTSKTSVGFCPQLPNETTTTKYLRQDGSWQVPPDNNTTYSAGTGIGLSGTSFYLPIPRVAESCNALPGAASLRFREYTAGANYNLPNNAWYQILEIRSQDTNYGTQLALGMTIDAAFYRKYSGGSWGSWKSIINTDTTYSAGSNITLSGTRFSLTKANVTGALGYTPPTSDTNNKVEVIHSTSNAEYPIIFEGHNNQTTYTTAVYKTAYVTVNPYHAYLYVKHTSNGTFTIINSTGIYFRGSTNARLWCDGAQQIWIAASDESDFKLFLGVANKSWMFGPGGNGKVTLGQASYRWGQIYSTNASISTSDRKEKKDIVPLDDSAVDFIMALNPVSYKMINGDSGRTHYGMIAQDVEEELDELGMTAMDFAGFCKDQKYERYEEVVDKVTTTRERKVEGEYIYGLRYEEFIAPLIKTVQLQQQEIEELKHRIDILEGK